MAQPVWITEAGSLGTIPEGVYYQTTMLADTPIITTLNITAADGATNWFTCDSTAGLYPDLNIMFTGTVFAGVNPKLRYFIYEVISSTQFSIATTEFSTTPVRLTTSTGYMQGEVKQHVYFFVQSGSLPAGVQISDNGIIEGIPKAVASIQGVPYEVAADVTSKFTVRAYTKKPVNGQQVLDRIAERTFELTVTGEDPPEWITPSGQIAQYYDGSQVSSLQLQYTNTDPGDVVTVSLVGGKLPTGLTLSPSGVISGFIAPLVPLGGTPGYSPDGVGFDRWPFDFPTKSISQNYEFVLELSDGKSTNLRSFSIFVWSRNTLDADSNTITADNTFLTADASTVRVPLVLNTQGSIGSIRGGNFFAYKFNGIDLDGSPFRFELGYETGDDPIPGVVLDSVTGWLYGYIPDVGLTENLYEFYVRAYKYEDPLIISNKYLYSLEIVGSINDRVVWITPSDLGTIPNGSTSTFYVEATTDVNVPLQYELVNGSDSNLPQGLQLLTSGHIAGRVSFNTFALDGGTTTFDVTLNDLAITGENTETTFDMSHTFVVRAFSVNGQVNVSKSFTITVDRVYNEPYDNLYIEAMPPENDRAVIDALLQNADIFQNDLLYRPDDPNFGKATNVTYHHAFGLNASTLEEYYSSLYINHYWKNLTLGEIQVAQARSTTTGEVIYEVVYSRVINGLITRPSESVAKEVTLPYPINEGDSTEIDVVYPASLITMREQVIDVVGQVGTVLPLWMTSEQQDGRILGFTPAWVMCYAKPGAGEQIAYYIREQFGGSLNLIDFEVDRYELDRLLTKNWDPVYDSTGGAWVPTPAETTFDASTFAVPWENTAGNTVTWVSSSNETLPWVIGASVQTTFDHGSLKFIAPVDMYSNTQEYDKYLVFPKRTILG